MNQTIITKAIMKYVNSEISRTGLVFMLHPLFLMYGRDAILSVSTAYKKTIRKV